MNNKKKTINKNDIITEGVYLLSGEWGHIPVIGGYDYEDISTDKLFFNDIECGCYLDIDKSEASPYPLTDNDLSMIIDKIDTGMTLLHDDDDIDPDDPYSVWNAKYWGLPTNNLISIFCIRNECDYDEKRFCLTVASDSICDVFGAIYKEGKGYRISIWICYESHEISYLSRKIISRSFRYAHELQEILLLARQYEAADIVSTVIVPVDYYNDETGRIDNDEFENLNQNTLKDFYMREIVKIEKQWVTTTKDGKIYEPRYYDKNGTRIIPRINEVVILLGQKRIYKETGFEKL